MDNSSNKAADLPDVSRAAQNEAQPSSSASEMAGLCPDWVLSTNSNVSTAVNRGWFKTYTPYETYTVDPLFRGNPTRVCGIGTVTIIIESVKQKSKKGKRSPLTLTLHNVLHIPTFFCNIIGKPFIDDNKAYYSFDDMALKWESGSIIALLEHRPIQSPKTDNALGGDGLLCLSILQVPELKWAKSELEPNTSYNIGAYWPDPERKKYIDHCKATASADTTTQTEDQHVSTPETFHGVEHVSEPHVSTPEEFHGTEHISEPHVSTPETFHGFEPSSD